MRLTLEPEDGETFEPLVIEQVCQMALVGQRSNPVLGGLFPFRHLRHVSADVPELLCDLIGLVEAAKVRLERELYHGIDVPNQQPDVLAEDPGQQAG